MDSSIDSGMTYGLLIAAFMVLAFVLPIYCCQTSNEEYEKVVEGIRKAKITLQQEA